MKKPPQRRKDHEPPSASEKWGWRYHHLGVPTSVPRKSERYLAAYKVYVSGFKTSPFGIEWMRYEPGSPISRLIQTVPHIAFEVDDLEEAIAVAARAGMILLGEPTSPGSGTRVAMILDNGAPVELIQFDKPARTPVLRKAPQAPKRRR